MSGNIRNVWIVSSVVLTSWIVVRSLAAQPEPVLDDPPIALASSRAVELKDASLAEVIHRFATLARIGHHENETAR